MSELIVSATDQGKTTPDAAVNNTAPNQVVQPTPAIQAGGTADTPTQNQQNGFPKNQVELDALIGSRLAEDRDSRAADAKKKASEKAGEFETLYKDIEPKYTTLKTENQTLKAQLTERDTELGTWRERENKRIDDAIKEWPAIVREFDPGKEHFAARIEWYDKARKHEAELTVQVKHGSGWSPTPSGTRGEPVTPMVSRNRF